MAKVRTTWQKSAVALFCQLILLASAFLLPGAACAQESSKADDLLVKISQSYEKSHDAWQVMELYACGLGGTADAEILLEETIEIARGENSDTSALPRNVIALSAAGYNCASLADGDGEIDAISKMSRSVAFASPLNVKISALLAYASGNYAIPADAFLSEKTLFNNLRLAQLKDGSFPLVGNIPDADMTALAVSALLPYAESNETSRKILDKACSALVAMQLPDGTWSASSQTTGNANSTAFAIIALAAMGEDPTKPLPNSPVAPMDALLAFANPDNSGFLYNGNSNALATEQGFRALIACKGYAAAKGSYNIYTEAAKATAVFAGASAIEPSGEPGVSDAENAAPTGSGLRDASKAGGALEPTQAGSKKAAESKKNSKKQQPGDAPSAAPKKGDAPATASSFPVSRSFSYGNNPEDDEEELGFDDLDYGDVEPEEDDEEFEDGESGQDEFATAADEFAGEAVAKTAEVNNANKTAWCLVAAGVLLLLLAIALYLRWGVGRKKRS